MTFKDVLFTQDFSCQWDRSAPSSIPSLHQRRWWASMTSVWHCFFVARNCPTSAADGILSKLWPRGTHREVKAGVTNKYAITATESQGQMLQCCRGNVSDCSGGQQPLSFLHLEAACSALSVYPGNIYSPQISDGVEDWIATVSQLRLCCLGFKKTFLVW